MAINDAKAAVAAAAVIRRSAPEIAPFTVCATVFEDGQLKALITMGGHAFTATLRAGRLVAFRVGWPVGE